MTPPRTAFFIEPQGPLRQALLDRKTFLEKTRPGQTYTLHPPHSTLLFGDYGAPDNWLDTLRLAVTTMPALTLTTDAWQEFPNDAQAHGGHTIAYRVKLTPELLALQQLLAETLAPFRSSSAPTHPLADREPFATSLARFGFPFVGPHWIPHFTIGSPRVPPGDPLLARLMAGSPVHETPADSVSIWRVTGEHHERLHTLTLSTSPSHATPS